MDSDDDHRVLDPAQDGAALKALTHPLRLTLLGLLRQHGPATASELAVRTGESSASTSYHLRVLAKYAFVTEADHRDGRERRWKSVHGMTSWSNEAMHRSPGGSTILSVLRRRQVEHLQQSLDRHEADLESGRLGQEWQEPSGVSDSMPRLTPESLAELWEVLQAKTDELTARDAGDPRAEQVVLFTAGLPLAPDPVAGPDRAAAAAGPGTVSDASDAGDAI
ncbi:helix-turn-helix domain-containing protein [Streptomyces sp. C11-1]|uniref:Helix-turn-helix domain-containing protein n=1 Tax=Streptomyces durocortorensis TaxID=2811104 RepID=A0ABY9VNP9_9ACTN|nr:helix-turn-helix domain-containing protein [Streptomyces durocortorensis]WNF25572.1 helix-turn-helix domain-containing protein [Streptomyces durocortorensis]